MKSFLNSIEPFYSTASAAFEAGEDERLEATLNEWQDIAASKFRGRMYPDTVHMRHTYQGMIALRNGNVEKAKAELIKSGKVPGSPMLSTLGPNMMLADALLQRGERKAVFDFFKALRNFWTFPIRMYFVRKWKNAIAAGEPDIFGEHVELYTYNPSVAKAA
jgi:hypothetical protein